MELKKRLKVFALVLVLFSGLALTKEADFPCKTTNLGLAPELAEKIESYIKEKMKSWHSPGLALGIVQAKEGLVYQGYFGWADIKEKKPIREDTVFCIGSISKTFTAIGLMQQWEKGKFKLNDPVNQYLSFPLIQPRKEGCREVTFLDLFTHTSGGGELMGWYQLQHPIKTIFVPAPKPRPPLEEVLAGGIRPGVCPGVKFAYCNYCYAGLGLLLEKISGERFSEYMEEHIFALLGLELSGFEESEELISHLAQGYHYQGSLKRFASSHFFRTAIPPAGGMLSCVRDLSLYLQALLNQGKGKNGQILKPETLKLMLTPHYQLDPGLGGIGICFFITNFSGRNFYGHGGAVPGFGSQIYFSPQLGLGVVVLCNIMNKAPYEISAGIVKILLGMEPGAKIAPAQINEKVAKEFEGYYGSVEPEFLSDFRFNMATLGAYQIRFKNGKLFLKSLRPGKKYRLVPVRAEGPYFYQILVPGTERYRYLIFKPSESGEKQAIWVGLNQYIRQDKKQIARTRLKALGWMFLPAEF